MDTLVNALSNAIPELLIAGLVTLVSAVAAGILAMVIAIPTAFARRSKVTLVRSIATFYVETIRGTPLLLQLTVWYFGVSLLVQYLFGLSMVGQVYNILTLFNSNSLFTPLSTVVGSLPGLVFAVIGLGVNYGAYIAEVIRGGIEAVPQGQLEAAESLGLSRWQLSRHIVLPQALRIMIPPITNNFITLIQDTSFLLVLGIFELTLRTQSFALANSNILVRWEFYIVELVMYFVLCYSLALFSRRMERRQAHMALGAQ